MGRRSVKECPMPFEWLLYPLLGIVAGLLAGLLGVGGGLVLVAALALLLPSQGVAPDTAMHAALATSLASVVVTAFASAYAHHRRGSVLWPSVAWLLPGLLLGGWLGSFIAKGIDGASLRWFVVGYCVLAALQLLLEWPRRGAAGAESAADAPRGVGMSLAGVGIGIVSALVGIGGGSMTVPAPVRPRFRPRMHGSCRPDDSRACSTDAGCRCRFARRSRSTSDPRAP